MERKNMEPLTLTHSALSMFRQCPRRYQHRYVDKIVPEHWADSAPLRFGTAFHNWLEAWYKGEPAPPHELDGDETLILQAACLAYAERYPTETWKVVAVEYQFEQDVLNPSTGSKSTIFKQMGKTDLVVEDDGELWTVEHKTSTATGIGDLERVGIDAQALTYADCIGREVGHSVAGVIYNVIKRCQLKRHIGETEEEYQAREAARRERKPDEEEAKYQARLKRIKEPLKRDETETPEQFVARCIGWYRQPGNMLRERARIDPRMIEQNRRNIWASVQSIHLSRRSGFYPQNAGVTTGACAKWGRECEYAALCKTLERPDVRATYKHQEPHSELESENE